MNEAVNITALKERGSPFSKVGDITMALPIPTQARVKHLFAYDSQTGNLLWNKPESARAKAGAIAGHIAANGRRYVGVDGRQCLVHHVIWLWHKGSWPAQNIAPENGDYLDTRIENLIEQTAQETVAKGRLRSTNKSGVKGVWFDKAKGKWAAQIVRDYHTYFVGRFATLEEAKQALDRAREADQRELGIHEHRRDTKKTAHRRKRAWNRMIRDCGGRHKWATIEAFCADVGSPPQRGYYVAPRDASKPIGPRNFVWSAPQHDYETAEGRLNAQRVWNADNADARRDKQLRRNFGITLAKYNELLEEQNGVCAICGNPETALRMGRLLPLSVDHNHRTGAARGLLCNGCNIGIGSLAESKDRLRKAITYLDKWEAIETAPLPDNVVSLKSRRSRKDKT
jgi:Recombination endonuclease VII/AP2 domain